MTAALDIAHDVADDLSLDRPPSLFPLYDDGDTTSRRLKRAIERACQHLVSTYNWQQSKREHKWLSVAGPVQPNAIPSDFMRFVPDTLWDTTRRIQLCMAETDSDWANLQSYPGALYPPRWVRRGNDILIHPEWTVSQMRYEYVSNAICVEPATPHVVEHTTDGMTLQASKRYVVKDRHTVIIPPLRPQDHLELVSDGGAWATSNVIFTTADGSPMANLCPVGYADWITVTKDGGRYVFRPAAGLWSEVAVPTTNGMMLEPGRRYAVQKGHVVYLPVMPNGERIEAYPVNGSWRSNNSRFVTREGTDIGAPQADAGLVTIGTDHTGSPQYVINPGSVEPWGAGRRKARFTTDRDEPIFDDEAVRLGAIWMMQYRDGNQYNEDFRAFERRIYDVLKGSEGSGKISMGRGGSDRMGNLRDRGRAWAMSQQPHSWGEFKP